MAMEKDKFLVLKVLCMMLPYGLKVKHEAQDFPSTLEWVDTNRLSVGIKADKIGAGTWSGNLEFIKPYLRPMSSMTGEERKEHILNRLSKWNSYSGYCANIIDWLNAHHFDYRGLIEKGLGLEAPEEMYSGEIVGVKETPTKTFPRVNEFINGSSYRH